MKTFEKFIVGALLMIASGVFIVGRILVSGTPVRFAEAEFLKLVCMSGFVICVVFALVLLLHDLFRSFLALLFSDHP